MPRKLLLSTYAAAQCLIVSLGTTAPAQAAASIPSYFFSEWTVTANCAEAHAGLAAKVDTGLKYRISPATLVPDGSYAFEAENSAQTQWAANWNGVKLQYRPGTQMTTVPADFECLPSGQSTSPFLAMSGFAVAAEPYYEQEHWYGLAKIQGQWEHILIFPRPTTGAASALIMLVSVSAPGTITLDDDGLIISHN